MLDKLIEFFSSWFANLDLKSPPIDYAYLFQIDPWLIVIVAVVIAAFIVIATILVIRAHHRQVSAGREDLIGKTAEVKTVMNPEGTVLIQGELWTAISEEGHVEPGTEVVLTKVDRLKVWVTTSNKVNR
jgi:membrane-bound ClpP family serine protease